MQKLTALFCLSLLLIACNALPTPEARSIDPVVAGNPTDNRGQMLPITAKAYINNEAIELEVARTDEQQAMGLMYRSSLPKNRGMLFPFGEARFASFWMKNVAIPLDMIFLKDGIARAVFLNVPPCTTDPCPVYGPATLVDSVIELAGGRAKELGVKVGDKIRIEAISTSPKPTP
jgi:uncharacterized membrane protein (UPF0127 family)